ncbi:MAG TPA: hypothetical protein VGC89_15385 [Pyrinomonadaceae bacterium]
MKRKKRPARVRSFGKPAPVFCGREGASVYRDARAPRELLAND